LAQDRGKLKKKKKKWEGEGKAGKAATWVMILIRRNGKKGKEKAPQVGGIFFPSMARRSSHGTGKKIEGRGLGKKRGRLSLSWRARYAIYGQHRVLGGVNRLYTLKLGRKTGRMKGRLLSPAWRPAAERTPPRSAKEKGKAKKEVRKKYNLRLRGGPFWGKTAFGKG